MSFGLVELNQSNIITECGGKCIQKALKMLTVEMGIFLLKVPATERCHDTIDLKVFPLLVRRAKLGFVYWVRVPVLEALARHQVLSVASALVTPLAKRTQGGHGLQCASVKGLSLDMK